MSSHLRPADTILVFLPEGAASGGLDEQLKAQLSGAHRLCFVRPAERFTSLDPHTYGVNPAHPEDYRRLLSALEQRHALPTHILHAGNCAGGAGTAGEDDAFATLRERLDEELARGLYSMLALVQAKLAANPSGATRCVFAFTADEKRPRPHHEAVSGLARALTTVDHRFELATVQMDRCDAATAARRLIDELSSPHHRNGGEVRYRDGHRYSHEIQPFESAPRVPEPTADLPLRAEGVYLVTGGSGGLGMLFARHLASTYRARLALSGRAPLDDDRRAMLAELASLGGRAVYVQADVGDAADTRRLIAAVDAEFGRLDGIFHCAGVADRTPLARATLADFERVLRPKVHGTLHLDLETRDRRLDVFVLFSSISALVGDFGAGSYSAANFFLDRFAEAREHLRRSGLRAGQTLSVNWPLWQDGGMKLQEQDKALYFEFSGMGALEAAQGIAAFEDALRAGRPQLLVMSGDRRKIDRILQAREQRPEPPEGEERRRPDAGGAAAPRSDRRSAAASPRSAASQGGPARPAPRAALQREQLAALTRDYLRRMLSHATKLPVEKIHADRDLEDYGINSLMIMELNSLLDRDFDSLPRTLFFEYKSLAELAAFFVNEHEARLQQLLGAPPAAAPPGEDHPPAEESATGDVLDAGPEPAPAAPGQDDLGVAVIGFGGRFPQADDLDAFWRVLSSGVDCITEIPRERWDWRSYHDETPGTPGKSYCKWGGFISDVDRFDPLFFRLSPRAAHSMDPQERLFLKVAWETLEHAGYTVDRLARGPEAPKGAGQRNRVGVFAGVMWGDYGKHGQDELHKGNPVIASADYSSIANRVSYALNLHGPSIAFDTACSSSLVAIHLACESLTRGECDYAIAGGVSLSLHPSKYLQMSNLKALSAEGKCRSFGAGGAGYVPGEGAGALLLKPLRRAIEDGDYIHAVIRGTAVNHDGKTNGYTVPNPNAQAEVISDALRQGGIDARTVSYVEAHGTGTELGDPIEVTGLTKSYRRDTKDRQFCALGSAKSNIGHLEGAAGVVGMIKVLLQLKHRQIAPSLHSQQLNPSIDFASSPFWVPQQLSAWERPRLAGPDGAREIPRRAGVSSFGAGGANAHVVLEEWENPPRARAGQDEALVVLSAMSEERLRAYAGKLAAWLSRADGDGAAAELRDLERVAYTLQTGREALESRLAVIAADHRQLIADLQAYSEGRQGGEPSRVFHGTVKPYELPELGEADRAALDEATASHDLTTIARRWIAGAAIDWRRLYPSPPPYPLALPTYPFARDRYWIPVVAERPAVAGVAGVTRPLHPFLDTNVSTLGELAFEKTFSSADPVLRDHVVAGRPVLPAAVYLEMARAAGRHAGRASVSSIHDAVWARPVIATGERVTLRISLASERGAVVYRIHSQAEGQSVVHGHGYLATDPPEGARPAVSVQALLDRCPRRIAGDELYRFFEGLGIHYGPAFRPVQALHCGEREAVALLRMPDAAAADGDEEGLNPSLLDGALQAIAHLGFDHELEPSLLRLPFTLGRLVIRRPLTAASCYAHAVLTQDSRAGGERVLKFRIEVLDPGGAVLIEIIDYSVRVVARGALGQPVPQAERAAPAHTLWYKPVWEATPAASAHAAAAAGELPDRILVLGREDELTSRLVGALSRVRPTRLLSAGTTFGELYPQGYRVDPADPSHTRRALEALSRDGRWSGGSLGIVHLWRHGAGAEEALTAGVHALLHLVQGLDALGATQRVRCLSVVGHRDGVADPHDEALAGFAAALAPATPHVEIVTVQAEPARLGAQELLDIVSSELGARDTGAGSEIRYTSSTARWTRALRQLAEAPARPEGAPPLRTGGVYLITGGCGHLGSIFARHLAGRHGARLVLSGRSPSDAAKDALIHEIRGLGGDAVYVQADVSDPEAARALVQAAERRFGGLHGIFHAAGTNEAPPVAQADAASFARVLGPKVQGTLNLDAASRHLATLDLFVLFSSIAAVMGDFGAGCYAYANAFMDRFAAGREAQRARGHRHGKTLAINWPLWAGEGMSLPEGQQELYAGVAGMRALDPALGVELFTRALSAPEPQLLVVHGDPERMRRVIERRNPRPPAASPAHTEAASSAASGDEHLAQAVEDYLRGHFAAVFKMDAAQIDAQASFDDYGIDSLMIVELHSLLDKDMTPLPRTTFFERRTLRAVADHLVASRGAELRRVVGLHRETKAPPAPTAGEPARPGGTGAPADGGAPARAVLAAWDEQHAVAGAGRDAGRRAPARPGATLADEDIAIIGMSGRYPMAPDLDAFWANLKAGRDCVEEIPAERWDHRRYFDPEPGKEGKSYCAFGGFIEDVDKFDPLFFQISPKQVATMDPQERLFLESAWATLEHGGYGRVRDDAARIGVFAGVMWDDYGLLGLEQAALGNHVPTGSDHASIANRISYVMNLRGPSLTVSTACSSSLLAVHLAVESLRRGECAMAIAGGVNLSIHPSKYTRLCQLQMLAPDGRCRSFGAGGKGYVPGEGVGAVLLKPLSRAEADGDTIYAVIKGSAVNHGGKTHGYTVPNPKAQADVIGRALERAGVHARTISYVEAHGTGTALGDPIEVGGLEESFRAHTSDRQYCALGSVKSNIGHLEGAAGIAALTKVALQMHHRQLVPSLHAEVLNPNIHFEGTPFYVQRTLDAWRQPEVREGGVTEVHPRRAGISSFGAGGTNVHMIVEAYEASAAAPEIAAAEPELVVLSAHTEERLHAHAERLLRFLEGSQPGRPASPRAPDWRLPSAAQLRAELRDIVARRLDISPHDVDEDAEMSELGLGALDVRCLTEDVERRFGLPVGSEALTGRTTVAVLAERLRHLAAPDADPGSSVARPAVRLTDLAYTLRVGRDPRQHRLALRVADLDELIEQLRRYCEDGAPSGSHGFTGQASRRTGSSGSRQEAMDDEARVRAAIAKRDLVTLGRLWVAGADVDWDALDVGRARRRIPLPTYPFARERYWFSRSGDAFALGQAGEKRLHPLVHANTSTLHAHTYSSRLQGDAFYLADHLVQGQKLLPAVAFLEMARAAADMASGRPVRDILDVVWTAPVVVDVEPREVQIALRPSAGGLDFTVSSAAGDAAISHAVGRVRLDEGEPNDAAPPLPLDDILSRCTEITRGDACYRRLQQIGLHHGSSMRALHELRRGQGEAIAEIRLPELHHVDFSTFALHPALLDAALLCTLGLLDDEAARAPYLPFAVGRVTLRHPVPARLFAHATLSATPPGTNARASHVTLVDPAGRVLVEIRDLTVRLATAAVAPAPAHRLYFRPGWRPQRIDRPAGERPPQGPVLLFDADDGLWTATRARLTAPVGLVRPGPELQVASDDRYVIDPSRPEHYRRLLDAFVSRHGVPASVLYLRPLRDDRGGAGDTGHLDAVLHLCRALQERRGEHTVRVLYAHPAEGSAVSPRHAALAAFARSVRREDPHLLCRTVAVPLDVDAGGLADALLAECSPDADPASEVRYHDGQRLARSFEPFQPDASRPLPLREEGVYVITGGAGGLGFILSDYLARRYRAKLVLCGRSPLSALQASRIRTLEASGAEVLYLRADVGQRDQASAVLHEARSRFGGIHGVVHAAGALRDALLAKKNPADVAAVISPKVTGTLLLDELTREDHLDFFLLCSSVAAILGSAGQADYAYGNAFMDAFAAFREEQRHGGRRSGLTVSVNWPLWQEGTMRPDADAIAWMTRATGMVPMATEQGLAALEDCLRAGGPQIAVLTGDPGKILALFSGERAAPTASGPAAVGPAEPGAHASRAVGFLKRVFSEQWQLPIHRIDAEQSLDQYGLDSIMAMSLTRRLETFFGELPKTLLFEYQTVAALAGYFARHHVEALRRVAGDGAPAAAPPPRPAAAPPLAAPDPRAASAPRLPAPQAGSPERLDIAIVGISGRYPMAPDLDAFWENLKVGRDCIVEIPADRWDHDRYFDPDPGAAGKSYAKWGGFIDDVDRFDPLFFNIAPREADSMDPQERVFLEVAWQALEDAGYARSPLANRATGVFVGVMYGHYQLFGAEALALGRSASAGSSFASIANRVSYFFDFRGPSIALDTMCSSSLTAIHLACAALQRGEIEMALAGGVNLSLHPQKYILLSRGKFVATDGRCRSFGEGGDGYVPGEGAGAVVLKRLDRAIAEGDRIYAVIKASALNHGGKTSGYTVPNPSAQADVIAAALTQAGVDPRTITYVEAHGTGTSLGDPIEITGLAKVFEASTQERQYCAIGSVKSNVGHLESAAGVAGLTKVLLQMAHEQLVPSIHADPPNPNINFAGSPFRVQRELGPWQALADERGQRLPLRAGLSSFGAGGANAHLVLEAYLPGEDDRSAAAPPDASERPQVLVLSARTPERLRVSAARLLDHLRTRAHTTSLADIAYSLQVGREAMDARLALVVHGTEQAVELLEHYVGGRAPEGGAPRAPETRGLEHIHEGSARAGHVRQLIHGRAGASFLQALLDEGDLDRIAALWVGGSDVDWSRLHEGARPRRVALPSYPFARERCWFTVSPEDRRGSLPTSAEVAATARLHPLLSRNTSTFKEQRFATTFTGEETLLSDHRIRGRALLPGTAYLEMARVAGELSAEDRVGRFTEVTWLQPIQVDRGPVEATLDLRPTEAGCQFRVCTQNGAVVHVRGQIHVEPEPSGGERTVDLGAIKARCPEPLLRQDCYRALREQGFEYGPAFQVIEAFYDNDEEALALLTVAEPDFQDFAGGLHPMILDAALHAGMLHRRKGATGNDVTPVPFYLEELVVFRPLERRCYAHLKVRRPAAGEERSEVAVMDVLLVDEAGSPLVRVKGFTGRKLVDADEEPEQNAVLFFGDLWQPAPLPSRPPTDAPPANLLVIAEDTPRLRAFERLVRGRGGRLTWVCPVGSPRAQAEPGSASNGRSGDGEAPALTIDPRHGDDYRGLLTTLKEQDRLPDGIIRLWDASGLDQGASSPGPGPASVEELQELFHLVVALANVVPAPKARLLLAFHGEEAPLAVEATSGFCRSLGLLLPGLRSSTIHWTHREPEGLAEDLWAELADRTAKGAGGRNGAEILYRGPDRLARTAAPAALEPDAAPTLLRHGGVYLIAGGAGGLGYLVAQHLAHRCRANLVLTGRSPLDAGKERQLAGLRDAGGQGLYCQADVADEAAMAAAVRLAKERFGALHGVIHAAGVLDERPVVEKTWAEFHENLRPKVAGSVVLDQLTAAEPLDFFAVFSSTSAVLGDFGSCDYGSGNRFQMAYGAHRERLRQQGLRHGITAVMNWPLWREGGMGGRAESERTYLRMSGLDYLDRAAGLAAFERILQARQSPVTVFYGKPSRVARALGLDAPPLPAGRGAAVAPLPPAEAPAAAPEGAVRESAARAPLREVILDAITEVLKVRRGAIAPDVNIAEYGFDSVSLAQLADQLGARLGLKLASLVFFEHTTVEEIEAFLERKHGAELRDRMNGARERHDRTNGARELHDRTNGARERHDRMNGARERHDRTNGARELHDRTNGARKEAPRSPEPTPANPAPPPALLENGSRLAGATRATAPRRPQEGASRGDIAIIGVSGRYPQAEDLRALWARLKAGESCIEEIPAERWDKDRYFDPQKGRIGKSESKWGGFLRDVDQFDPLLFNIPPARARLMDPMQRLFLESVYETLEDAGYTRAMLSKDGGKVGVYVGAIYHHYAMLAGDEATRSLLLSAFGAHIANHVSHFFDLHGPCFAVDTTCASSLTAIHLACEGLLLGRTDLAIAGGVNLSLIPEKYLGLSQLQFMSGGGLSRPFGDSDGMIPGEGVGAVLLKPLDHAVRDRDHIHAVIRSSAISHGGASTGFTAPNLKAQSDMFVEALERSGFDPRTISYVEAAANGAPLGDPVEVNALTRAFRRFTADTGFCALGTVKSNIGHLEGASGVSQLAKVLLQLRHGALAPTINAEPRNPNLHLDDTPFYLQERLEDWPRPVIAGREVPRRAMINSIGAGGGYATLVVEEHRPPPRDAAPGRSPAGLPELFVLSARSRKSLRELVVRMRSFLAEATDLRLDDVAYTLQVGREALDLRLAVVADTAEALIAALDAYLRDPEVPAPGVFIGQTDGDTASGAVAPPAQAIRTPEEAARRWVAGAAIDMEALYPRRDARRIPLPTYPFDRRRCWLDPVLTDEASSSPAALSSEAPRPAAAPPASPAAAAPPAHPSAETRELDSYLCARLESTLGLDQGEVSARASLRRLGLDSILTAKLKVTLEGELAMTIPMEAMSGEKSVAELGDYLSRRGARAPESPAKARSGPAGADLSTSLKALSGAVLRERFLAFGHDLAGVPSEELTRLYAILQEER